MGRKTANRARHGPRPVAGRPGGHNGGNGHKPAQLGIPGELDPSVSDALESLRTCLLEVARAGGGGHAGKMQGRVAGGDDLIALRCADGRQCVLGTRPQLEGARRSGNGGGARTARGPLLGEPWESYLERTPLRDLERQKLLLLLERHEWNIARVARLLGMARRTVYARLERYRIPRRRVLKASTSRRAPAPRHVSRRSRGPRRDASS
jgi:hypothetical protein